MKVITSKQQAFDLFEQERREFLAYARWIAEKIYDKKGHVTIDDVRAECPLPLNIDGRVYGAVFNRSDWTKTGYTQTTTGTSHGRPIGIFVRKAHSMKVQYLKKVNEKGQYLLF